MAASFFDSYKLTTCNIPDSVVSIGEYAFYGCSALQGDFILPSEMTEVPAYLLYECSQITSVVISENVVSIGEYSLYRTGITSFELKNVAKIGTYAFAGCLSLKEININAAVKSIGAYSFYQSGLTDAYFEITDKWYNSIGFTYRFNPANGSDKDVVYDISDSKAAANALRDRVKVKTGTTWKEDSTGYPYLEWVYKYMEWYTKEWKIENS